MGSGTLTLTAADNAYGATIVSAGTLQVGDGNTGSLGQGNVIDNGSLVFDYATGASPTVTNAITGTGSLAQAGANALALTGADGFNGAIGVSDGELLTGALAQTISVSGNATDETGDAYNLGLFSSGGSPITGWRVASSDGGTWFVDPGNAYATHTFAAQGNLRSPRRRPTPATTPARSGFRWASSPPHRCSRSTQAGRTAAAPASRGRRTPSSPWPTR